MQIGARKIPRRRATTLRVERLGIVGMARVLDVDRAEAGESNAVAAIARRQHTIEHVDAASDGFEEIGRRADAHEITRPLRRQRRRGLADDFEHHALRFADGKPADGITGEADIDEPAHAVGAQLVVVAALHDAEQGAAGGSALERALAALGPAQ